MAAKIGWVVTYLKRLRPTKSHDSFGSQGLLRLWDELTYLHHHNAYGHQTWQAGKLLWGTPTHNITWSFNQVGLRVHVTNLKLQDENLQDEDEDEVKASNHQFP